MSRKKSLYDKKKLKKIGSRIKSLRKSLGLKGLSQSEFGNSIGISGNYVSDIETGKVEPSRPILLAIEFRYSVTPEEILNGDGDLYIIKDKLVEGVAEHVDNVHTPISINKEENELIQALREIDPISRKGVYLSAMEQFNEAMRERKIRKDKRKKELLEKTIKTLTKAVGEM